MQKRSTESAQLLIMHIAHHDAAEQSADNIVLPGRIVLRIVRCVPCRLLCLYRHVAEFEFFNSFPRFSIGPYYRTIGRQGYGDSDGNFLYQQNRIRYSHRQFGDCTRRQIL